MTNSEATFSRITGLRAKLAEAVEAGEQTGDLRQAIKLLEEQCIAERTDEADQAVMAERQQAEAAITRAAELTEQACTAISSSANRFNISKD